MKGVRSRWLAAVAVVAVVAVASGCGGSGTRARSDALGSEVRTSNTRPASSPHTAPIAAAPAAVPPVSLPSTTPTTIGTPSAPAAAPAPTPTVVSIVALADAAFTQNGVRPCSNTSSQSIARGQLEVRRTGSTAADLAVYYAAAGAEGDHAALPGQVVIPAGASSAVIQVDPHLGDVTSPRHDHHSSTLSVSLQGGPGYSTGVASASIAVRFAVDIYGCAGGVVEGAALRAGAVS